MAYLNGELIVLAVCRGRQIKDMWWFFVLSFILLFMIAAGGFLSKKVGSTLLLEEHTLHYISWAMSCTWLK